MEIPSRSIAHIAESIGIDPEILEPYGRYVAKLPLPERPGPGDAPLIMVTAITPTPLGEGKTTTAIGLAQGLARIGRRPILTLRQPSLGPTFGIKGGAAGAGRSRVLPAEVQNLHLTGDFHAVTAAHNLLAAMVDNHLFHGNALEIDERTITWPRVTDTNDRALRHVVIGLGGRGDGVTRQGSFDITAASEVMTILSLANDRADLRDRLARIVVARTAAGKPVTAGALGAAGAMAVILKDALRPNLLQTTEGTPVLIHTGPFGNIATGNSSVVADLVASHLGDVVITESGFGADLGAERLVNIKSRLTGMLPAVAVIVATVRALKAHSGGYTIVAGKPLPSEMLQSNPMQVAAGCKNLGAHLEIVKQWGITPVVAINAFPGDHASEHEAIARFCDQLGVRHAVTDHVARGGAGAEDLARAVEQALSEPTGNLNRDYELHAPLTDKIEAVARRVYNAQGVEYSTTAKKELERFTALGYEHLPVVIAKTHLSISHSTAVSSREPWTLPVREVRLAAGAGYVYAICGAMSTMPGLPSHPRAVDMDLDNEGNPLGLT